MKIYFLAALAATRQLQLDCAGLSTSLWTVSVWQRRIVAAKTQLQLGGLRPRPLKPSYDLTVLQLHLRGKEMHGNCLPCICYYFMLLNIIISSSATFWLNFASSSQGIPFFSLSSNKSAMNS